MYYACQAYYSCHGPRPDYLPCRLLANWTQRFSATEDIENYFTRGPASRAGDSTNLGIWLGLPALQKLVLSLDSGGNHLWCTHDSVSLPLVTLMDLFDFGTVAAESNASRLMPMASRLIVRRVAGGPLCIHFNGRLVGVEPRGLQRLREIAESRSLEAVCASPGFAEL